MQNSYYQKSIQTFVAFVHMLGTKNRKTFLKLKPKEMSLNTSVASISYPQLRVSQSVRLRKPAGSALVYLTIVGEDGHVILVTMCPLGVTTASLLHHLPVPTSPTSADYHAVLRSNTALAIRGVRVQLRQDFSYTYLKI